MTLTKHAVQRSQQRGVMISEIELILQIGTIINKPGGAYEVTVLKKDKATAINHLKKIISKIDNLEGKTIITDGESIITTYYKGN